MLLDYQCITIVLSPDSEQSNSDFALNSQACNNPSESFGFPDSWPLIWVWKKGQVAKMPAVV